MSKKSKQALKTNVIDISMIKWMVITVIIIMLLIKIMRVIFLTLGFPEGQEGKSLDWFN